MNREQLAARLLATFVGELEEQVQQMNRDLLALETSPADTEGLRSLFRVVHTLKGAARAAGVVAIESVCHELESMLIPVRDGRQALDAEALARLFHAADALADAGARLRRGDELSASPIAHLASAPGAPLTSAPEPDRIEHVSAHRAGTVGGTVRVEEEKLEAVFAGAGELSIAVAALEELDQDLHQLEVLVGDWSRHWRRVRRRLRVLVARAEVPAELHREIEGIAEDVRAITTGVSEVAVRGSRETQTLARVSSELTRRVYGLHTRPVADGWESLPRLVRDLATAAHKSVRLETSGGDVEADRVVIDALREPIVHLVRNAVDHGIESPQTRTRAGKPEQGRVRVSARLQGDRLVLRVEDDGGGVDVAGLRARLAALGRPAVGGDLDLANVLFEGGISTRAEATEISGRGVGLDIVRSAVEQLNGSVDVQWTAGAGTSVTIESPVSLATLRGVVARVSGQCFIVPSVHVSRLLHVRPEDARRVGGRTVLPTADGPVPLVTLAHLLGPPLDDRPFGEAVPVMLLDAGHRRLALAVDELMAERNFVLQRLPFAGRAPRHLSGAAMLGSGRVALVVNAMSLTEASAEAVAASGASWETSELRRRARVLVVDDSITTRTLEQSVLEAAGYDVITAVDGADGWRLLQEQPVDLVVADVEMPRMDGFALCRAIRASKRFGEVPVVLVTALESPENRALGLEAGADAYLGKSSFDQRQLLDIARELLGA